MTPGRWNKPGHRNVDPSAHIIGLPAPSRRPLQRSHGGSVTYARMQPELVLAGTITVGIVAQSQAQDAAIGEHLFRNNCSICHSPQPGRNLIGPSLFNVI
jgi:mono/diheme cytochrome c family protein